MRLKNIPASQGISILYGHRILPTLPQGIGPYADTTITVDDLTLFFNAHHDWQKLSLTQCLSGDFDSTRPAMAMTFDDGYRDIIDYGLPVLESFDCPVTVFLTSGFCLDKREPLENIFAARLQQSQTGNKDRIYQSCRADLKKGSYKKRIAALQDLTSRYGLDEKILPHTEFLNSADILKIGKHPLVTLGLHSKTHPLLTHLPVGELWDELVKPKRILESLTWQKFSYLAYPYGGHHATVRILARFAKYRAGFTTGEKLFTPSQTPHFAIPRIALRAGN